MAAFNDDDDRREKFKKGWKGENQGPWKVADDQRGQPIWQDKRVGRDESKYPHNKVTHTRSGHLVEIDDTPGFERIRIRHASGSYLEMYEDGMVQWKSENDMMISTDGNMNVKMIGDFNIHVTDGNLNIKSDGTAHIQTADLKMKTGKVDWDASGEFTLKATKINFNP